MNPAVIVDEIYKGVLDGLPSLAGKCVAITGCTSGTGLVTALSAVTKGASCVLLLNRKSERSEAAQAKVKEAANTDCHVETVECDLQSFVSVRAAAAAVAVVAERYGGLDCLINNAGIMAVPDKRTSDGFDVQMQSNHLSHFLLTKLLLPSLEAAAASRGEARVVQHSSSARSKRMSPDGEGNLDSKYFSAAPAGELGGDAPGPCFGRYQQTKLANSVFAMALHEKLSSASSKVKSLVAEPGVCVTSLGANLMSGHTSAGSDTSSFQSMFESFKVLQSAEDGACSLLMASFAVDAGSGDFYMPGTQREGMTMGMPVKCISEGSPAGDAPDWIKEKFEKEMLSLHKPNHDLLWKASEDAIGEAFTV